MTVWCDLCGRFTDCTAVRMAHVFLAGAPGNRASAWCCRPCYRQNPDTFAYAFDVRPNPCSGLHGTRHKP